MKNFILYWLPTLVWMGLIFFLSSRPTIHTTDIFWQDFILKKAAHFIEYFILTFLLFRSLKYTSSLSSQGLLLVVFILVVLYASTDEFHQSFIPGREPRVRDVVIDSSGSLVCLWYLHHRGHGKI